MIRREIPIDIRRYSICWKDLVRREANRTKIVLVLLTKEEMMRRREGCENRRMRVRRREDFDVRIKNGRTNVRSWEECDDGRLDWRRNGRIKVMRREGWEGFAQRFNIAAGFSPGKNERNL